MRNPRAAFVLVAVVFACFSPVTNHAYAQEQKQKVAWALWHFCYSLGLGRYRGAVDLHRSGVLALLFH